MQQPDPKRPDSIQSLTRAMDLLLVLQEHPEGLPIRGLARCLGLAASTTHRLLKTLEETNLVIACPQGFRLGPALVHLAGSVRPFDIVSMAHPVLLSVAGSTGETVNLVILSKQKALVADQAVGRHPLMAASKVGSNLPLHGTACGKALLAALPSRDLASYREGLTLSALTPRTIVDWPRLTLDLESVRETGLAFEHQEHAWGICSIATALPLPGPVMAAVSVAIPTQRYREVETRACEALLDCRNALHRRWQEHGSPATRAASM